MNSEAIKPAGATELSRAEAPSSMTTARGAAEQNAMLPAVDIFEDDACVTIMADMPGVSRDRLVVRVDGDGLMIEGAAKAQDSSPGMEIVYGEVLNPIYRRSFTLSRDLDPGKIEASLNQGVLKLVIPKSEEAKPRRIEVKVG
jgi:HSP20 family protein